MGGGTASCTSRVEDSVAAVLLVRAVPPLCTSDGGADPYFFFWHSAVVWVVEEG